jgi:hypothetical protein
MNIESPAYRKGRRAAFKYLRDFRRDLPAPQSPYNGATLCAEWQKGFDSVSWADVNPFARGPKHA